MQVQGLGWIPRLLSVSLRNVPCFQNRWPPNSREKPYSLETPDSVKVRGDRVRLRGWGVGWGTHRPLGRVWVIPPGKMGSVCRLFWDSNEAREGIGALKGRYSGPLPPGCMATFCRVSWIGPPTSPRGSWSAARLWQRREGGRRGCLAPQGCVCSMCVCRARPWRRL